MLAIERESLQDARFRIAVEPEEGELLSSWLIRTAYAHHIDTATFINQHFPQWKNTLWTRDVDVSADEEFLTTLAFKSGLDYHALYNLTLKSYEGYLAETITNKTRNAFIQPLGNYSRIKVKYGLRFCSECLREDERPYFRRKWRLSFSTACIKHKCFLFDRCPSCGASVTLNKSFYDLHFPDCYKCGADLREALPERIQEGSYGLWAIKRLYEILDTGMYTYTGGYSYSFFLFNVLQLFVRIIYFWGKDKGVLDHEVMRPYIDFGAQKPKEHLIENIPLKEQYLLFSGLVRLFEDFPGRVLSFCGGNRLRGSDLSKDMKSIPFWYQKVADEFNMVLPPVSKEEVSSVIRHLKERRIEPNKANVARMMGICPCFNKRIEIQRLFKL